ncbi:MAG: amidohydrolase family protein [Vicinamibacteria bacterium]|nr:amidohydrolase family protein [Vicinamibacteria bacterium]
MTFDLKIVGGSVVDGSGSPAFAANVGMKDGRIAEIGRCDGAAKRTIDAEGAIVTPGFVDLHTHYDGQATWDQDMLPSAQHGVTTAIMGNCGVGFAPVHDADHERLIGLMEGVEDIPGAALAEGLRWGWRSFPEYLDVLESMPRTLDIAAQLPHDALRLHVMGDRGAAQEPARHEDIAAMRDLCREALEAGAIGFSTGRTDNHRTVEGNWTPSSESTAGELQGIASAFDGLGHGVIQAVSDFDMLRDLTRFEPEFDLLESMAAAARGRPMSISLLERDQAPNQWRSILRRVGEAAARGLPMRVQVAARPIGLLLGLDATFHPFMGFPTYKSLAHLPLAERARRLAEPETKKRLLSEKSERVAGDGSPIPPLADLLLAQLGVLSRRLFPLRSVPDYEPVPEASLFAAAADRGVTPLEAILDALLLDEGRALLYFPLFNYQGGDLEHLREMIEHPLALAGLGDGGAHVGTTCDASFPTTMIAHWTRDRTRGQRLSLERVVAMLSARNADFVGLSDRGRIRVGLKADLNVIDLGKLGLDSPRLVRDLPAGGKRFLQDAHGYRATVVAGEVTLDHDRLTGARPGRLIRAGR